MRSTFQAIWKHQQHIEFRAASFESDKEARKTALIAICTRAGAALVSLSVVLDTTHAKLLRCMPELVKCCPNIELIELRPENVLVDVYLPSKFSLADIPKLKSFIFTPKEQGQRGHLPARTLRSLPASIEEIADWHMYDEFAHIRDFRDIISAHCRLRRVAIANIRCDRNDLTHVERSLFPSISCFCPQLKEIQFSGGVLPLDGIDQLVGVRKLVLKHDSYRQRLTNAQIVAFCVNNPDLREIDVCDCFDPGDLSFDALLAIANLKRLCIVSLRHVGHFKPTALQELLLTLLDNSGASIREIKFDFYAQPRLAAPILDAIAEKCVRLRRLQGSLVSKRPVVDSLRNLIDKVTQRPKWKPRSRLKIDFYVECPTVRAAVQAMIPNLPRGVAVRSVT